jgi:hypothetical protein
MSGKAASEVAKAVRKAEPTIVRCGTICRAAAMKLNGLQQD